mmetsp:Transcript_1039/g.1895  ORF Transcript_1039/g.1895 Transcript_1039/m.1895 type:complete len:215 (-) Transcript_1039:42-686(-)
MPLYEMRLISRIGESSKLSDNLKTICNMVLTNGGTVRSIYNLGDRVLVKNIKSNDGLRYSIGRFINMEFDANPELREEVFQLARKEDEMLKVYVNKIREEDYLNRIMKRVNAELSPFRDKSHFDEEYIRAMWTKYMQLEQIRTGTTPRKVAQDMPKVAEFVRQQVEFNDQDQVLSMYKGGTYQEMILKQYEEQRIEREKLEEAENKKRSKSEKK